MITIEKVPVGFPAKMASKLMVRTMPINTSATTCGLYYELYEEIETISEDEEVTVVSNQLANGNLELNEQEFTDWDDTMTYIEDLALLKLGLTRVI